MTIRKGFTVIILSGLAFGAAGTAIGWSLGQFAPAFYRGVFPSGDQPWFDPVQVGFGVGLTQGLLVGLAVGGVVVLASAWVESRRGDGKAHSAERLTPPAVDEWRGGADVGVFKR